jgi:hypothetical protein
LVRLCCWNTLSALTVACRWRFRGDVSKEKGVILIVFTIALGIDLSQVHSLIKTGITVAALYWPPWPSSI